MKIANLDKSTFFRFTFLNVILFISIIFFSPRYGTPDDWILSQLVAGDYTGTSETNLIFIQPLVGFLFKISQTFSFMHNPYSIILVQIFILILSLFNPTKRIKKNQKIFSIIWIIQSTFILILFLLRPTYTNFAIYTSTILLLILLFDLENMSTQKQIFIWILLSLCILIRIESLFILFIYSIVLIGLNMIFKNSLKTKKFLLGLLILIFTLLANQIISIMFSNTKWNNYNLWNSMRHQIHNRISQFKLDQMLVPGGWGPEEHNLFVDWAYADPKVFDINWLKIAFDFTKEFRGLQAFKNLELDYFVFNLDRYNFFGNWALIIICQVLIFIVLHRNLNIQNSIILLLFSWLPSLIIFLYSGFFLLIPDRVVLPLVTLPVFINIIYLTKFDKKITIDKYSYLVIIFVVFIYIYQISQVNKDNLFENRINQKTIEAMSKFKENVVYLAPGSLNPFYSQNPFTQTNKYTDIKFLNIGSWDTFSPHWYKRKEKLGLNNESAYQDLLLPNVYYIGQEIPDTSLNIELLMEKAYNLKITRKIEYKIQENINIYKFMREN